VGIQIRIRITLLIFIPDAETDFSPSRIPPGNVLSPTQIPDPGPASKNFNFLSKKIVYNLYKIGSGFFNPDPGCRY
jgi:hypothetical protein